MMCDLYAFFSDITLSTRGVRPAAVARHHFSTSDK